MPNTLTGRCREDRKEVRKGGSQLKSQPQNAPRLPFRKQLLHLQIESLTPPPKKIKLGMGSMGEGGMGGWLVVKAGKSNYFRKDECLLEPEQSREATDRAACLWYPDGLPMPLMSLHDSRPAPGVHRNTGCVLQTRFCTITR